MRKVERERWITYFEYRDNGLSPPDAAKRARISPSSSQRFERGDPTSTGLTVAAEEGRTVIGGKTVAKPVCAEALEALEDFAKFRRRYFGRRATPWQTRAANQIRDMVESDKREYAVINCPPGAGKSTLFTHDVVCWLICRNRGIRIIIGSRTEKQARLYVGRVKKSLERTTPLMGDPAGVARGDEFDAVATLANDFGQFRPWTRDDLWRSDQLCVRQLSGEATDDKEPTVSAYGVDSGVLGARCDFIIWDDLVDKKNISTQDALDKLIHWWKTEGETRLEPGGTLVLQGQRLAYDDLYRFCLDLEVSEGVKKYRHILYRAHDVDKCPGEDVDHDGLPAWPNGCQLDPVRLPWSDLRAIKYSDPRVFDTVYQQNDGDKVNGLVQEEWVTGGVDSDGFTSPGCLDRRRAMGDIAALITEMSDRNPDVDPSRCWSYVTIDPSPTEFWGIIWWLYDPVTGHRNMVELWRDRFETFDVLGYNIDDAEFSGLLVDTLARSIEGGIPITDVIFERNAAQRWFLDQPHVQKWQQITRVRIHPHTTGMNKSDPEYGVESTAAVWRQGLIRIPYGTPSSRIKAKYLIDEALRYPDSKTTDLVMSVWFGELALANMYAPPKTDGPRRTASPFHAEKANAGLSAAHRAFGW